MRRTAYNAAPNNGLRPQTPPMPSHPPAHARRVSAGISQQRTGLYAAGPARRQADPSPQVAAAGDLFSNPEPMMFPRPPANRFAICRW